jgi:hypothetical protein
MTMQEFVRKLRDLARKQRHSVLAIDFEPSSDGIDLTIRLRTK